MSDPETPKTPITILTADEAATVLRVGNDDADMLNLLPLVDRYIEMATGRNWTADAEIEIAAKSAARMLLVQWYENPSMLAGGIVSLEFGLNAALTQLEAKALALEKTGVPEKQLAIVTSLPLMNDMVDIAIDVVLVFVFNHVMKSEFSTVSLADRDGNTVEITCALDITGKILTVTPKAALTSQTRYIAKLTAFEDVYGETLTHETRFKTA